MLNKASENPQLRYLVDEIASAVIVITSHGQRGESIGLTVNSLREVSTDPPLLLWSLSRQSRQFDAFATASWMAVHLLSAGQQDLAQHFSEPTETGLKTVSTWRNGVNAVPVLANAHAILECTPWQQYDGGDHLIHVMKIEHFEEIDKPVLKFYAKPQTSDGSVRTAPAKTETSAFVDNYLPYLIGRAGFEINRSFGHLLREHDIMPVQWRVLATLADRRMTVGELASIVLLQQPTLTKLLDRMEKDTLVMRENHPQDRRKVLLNVTKKGRALARKLTTLALRHEKHILAQVPALARPEVEQALRALIEELSGTD